MTRRSEPEALKLANANLGLVYKFAFEAARKYGTPSGEFISVAWGALLDAARTFDESRGFKFSTFAVKAILRDIQDVQRTERRHSGRVVRYAHRMKS